MTNLEPELTELKILLEDFSLGLSIENQGLTKYKPPATHDQILITQNNLIIIGLIKILKKLEEINMNNKISRELDDIGQKLSNLKISTSEDNIRIIKKTFKGSFIPAEKIIEEGTSTKPYILFLILCEDVNFSEI